MKIGKYGKDWWLALIGAQIGGVGAVLMIIVPIAAYIIAGLGVFCWSIISMAWRGFDDGMLEMVSFKPYDVYVCMTGFYLIGVGGAVMIVGGLVDLLILGLKKYRSWVAS